MKRPFGVPRYGEPARPRMLAIPPSLIARFEEVKATTEAPDSLTLATFLCEVLASPEPRLQGVIKGMGLQLRQRDASLAAQAKAERVHS